MARAFGAVGFHTGRLHRREAKSPRLIFALLIGFASGAYALEESGHNMVAQLMVPLLNESSEAEMVRLFGDEWRRDLVFMAPSIQSSLNNPRFQDRAPLQLTLFNEDDEGFDPAINCPNNACSVAAILESQQILLRTNRTDAEKRQALLYLMHYMIQLHIPINAGFVRDMGGQNIYLRGDDLQPVNFSWIWNSDLYRQMDKHWFSYAQELNRKMDDFPTASWTESLDPRDWAFEIHQIAVDQVYPLALEGRYSANLINQGQALLETQLVKAAYRTAALINDIYGDGLVSEEQ